MNTRHKSGKSSRSKRNVKKEMQAEFPGYPPYTPKDDIMQRNLRVEGNLDGETYKDVKKGVTPKTKKASRQNPGDYDGSESSKNEFDVTKEDLEALGPKELSLDMGDDEDLKHRRTPVDFSGEDLDIPGSELDDQQEEIGSEDEENNHYSQ